MGVVHGKITFINTESPYEFIKSFCLKRNIPINHDEPNHKFIDTAIIPMLKVLKENDKELKGWGGSITVFEKENETEIQFGGINSEIMKSEFTHHYDEYYKDQL